MSAPKQLFSISRADEAVFIGDVGEERVHRGIGRDPGPLDDSGNLDELAVVPAGEHRREGNLFGLRHRAASDPADG